MTFASRARIVTASWDGHMAQSDAQTGAQTARIAGDGYGMMWAAHVSDTAAWTVQSDGLVRRYDTDSVHAVAVAQVPTGVVDCVFSRDGRLVAAAITDGTVHVHNLALGVHHVVARDTCHASACALSRDGMLLAVSYQHLHIHTYQGAQYAPHQVFDVAGDNVNRCAISTDGCRLAAALATGKVPVWDTHTAARVWVYSIDGPVIDCAFSADDRLLATAAAIGIITMWSTYTGNSVFVVQCPHMPTCCALAPDSSQLVVATMRGGMVAWRLPAHMRAACWQGVLVLVVHGRRRMRARLPDELWQWMFDEGMFFYE
jgi:WD40 repeat protein